MAITPVFTPRDGFLGRSTSRFGVGETIALAFNSDSEGNERSALTWSIAAGGGTLSGTGSPDGRTLYTAPATEGQVTLVLKASSGDKAGDIVATAKIMVVAPTDVRFIQKPGTGIEHTYRTWSCGFIAEVFVLPSDVSFAGVLVGEGRATSVATGFLSRFNGMEYHPELLYPVGPGNKVEIPGGQRVSTGLLEPPYGEGSFEWNIPWLYSVDRYPAVQFAMAAHYATSSPNGEARIRKKDAGPFVRRPEDPTTGF